MLIFTSRVGRNICVHDVKSNALWFLYRQARDAEAGIHELEGSAALRRNIKVIK